MPQHARTCQLCDQEQTCQRYQHECRLEKGILRISCRSCPHTRATTQKRCLLWQGYMTVHSVHGHSTWCTASIGIGKRDA